jgi:hypothetical protein
MNRAKGFLLSHGDQPMGAVIAGEWWLISLL